MPSTNSGPDDGQHNGKYAKIRTKTTSDLPEEAQPSLMQSKFMAADAAEEEAKADWNCRAVAIQKGMEKDRKRKELYFFYGSLTDPTQLQRVLGLTERPRDLKPAEIVGYHIKMWGPYPALLDGPPRNVVKGMAYEVEGWGNKDKLAHYETNNYKEHRCIIRLQGGGRISGTTFEWSEDVDDLKDGSFDLNDWQMAHLLDN